MVIISTGRKHQESRSGQVVKSLGEQNRGKSPVKLAAGRLGVVFGRLWKVYNFGS
jgi:hypothetical protein